MSAGRPDWLDELIDKWPLTWAHTRDSSVVVALLGLILVGSVRAILTVGRAVLGVRHR